MPYEFPVENAPLNTEILATEREGSVTVHTLRYFSHHIVNFPLHVAAYLAIPEGDGPYPGLLHLHGGAQQAEKSIAVSWAEKGFATLCIDWSVCANVPNAVHATAWPVGMPNMQGRSLPPDQCSVPHVVAGARRGLDLLCERPEVNSERLGMVGISWGGFMTWLVNGTDTRLRCAVPVYGCGFACTQETERLWFDHFHPDHFARTQHGAVLHANGTHDFFGKLRQAETILARVPVDRKRIYVPNEDHGLSDGAREMIWSWLRHYLQDGPVPPAEPVLEREGQQVKADAPGAGKVFLHTLNQNWEEDVWCTREVPVQEWVDLPRGSGSAYLTARYPGGEELSSPVKILPGKQELQIPAPKPFLKWETGNLVAHRHPGIHLVKTDEGFQADQPVTELAFFLRVPEARQHGFDAFRLEWTGPAQASLEIAVHGTAGPGGDARIWTHPRFHAVKEGRQSFICLMKNLVGTQPEDGKSFTDEDRIRAVRIAFRSIPPTPTDFYLHGFTWEPV